METPILRMAGEPEDSNELYIKGRICFHFLWEEIKYGSERHFLTI